MQAEFLFHPTVLFWEIHCKLLQNISSVSLKGTKKAAIAVHYNKAKFTIIRQ